MSDDIEMLEASVSRLLAQAETRRRAGENGAAEAKALWDAMADAGLPLVLAPEAAGGIEMGMEAAVAVARLAGRHAVSAPIAETMLANQLAAAAGLDIDDGPATLALPVGAPPLTAVASGRALRVSGALRRIPDPRGARRVLALASRPEGTVLVILDGATLPLSARRETLAREPRDDADLDGLDVAAGASGPLPFGPEEILLRAALLRAAQMVGAMEAALEMTGRYAADRAQFGRPLAKFQAIQHQIAAMAGQVAACQAAAAVGAAHAEAREGAFHMAVAKARISEAAAPVAAVAHQVHGAMGYTREYDLHRFTTRLWSWRDDYGGERFWQARLGERAFRGGPRGLWKLITQAA